MAEQQTASSPPTLLQELRATASWTRDIPAKFPSLPLAVRAHLEMVEDLLGRVHAALVEPVQKLSAPKPDGLEKFIQEQLADDIRNLARQDCPEFRGQYYGECRGMLKTMRLGEMLDEAQREQWSADIYRASLQAAEQCAANGKPADDSSVSNQRFQLEQLAIHGITPRSELPY